VLKAISERAQVRRQQEEEVKSGYKEHEKECTADGVERGDVNIAEHKADVSIKRVCL
jgi:hypothetical protein